MVGLTLTDYIALVWFAGATVGFTIVVDHSPLGAKTVTAVMAEHRHRWMLMMLYRDLRMVDTTIQGNLLSGVAFFASTSILLVGGLLAALGATDQAVRVLADLPLAIPTSRSVWELKVLLLVAIFIYAFFKFAWSFRLFNYCSILIGSAPLVPDNEAQAEAYASRASKVNTSAANHFNRGLRSYYFALAALGWFIHPIAFIVGTTWVLWILYRREFRSRSYYSLKEVEAEAEVEADAGGCGNAARQTNDRLAGQ